MADQIHRGEFAVITGASSGIGLELARQFVDHGYDVLVTAEDAGIHAVAESLKGASGSVHAVQVDLAIPGGVDTLYAAIKQVGRPVDAIAINAGVGVSGAFIGTDLGAELNMINLNVISTVHLAKHIARNMVAAGKGKMLFTASVVSVQPSTFMIVYSATKAFVLNFAEGLRNELKDTGVTVTALMPGATDTNFFARAGLLDTKVGQSDKDDPADVAKDGFDALMDGRDHVIAHSLKSKLTGLAGELLPASVTAEMNRAQNEPGSAKQ